MWPRILCLDEEQVGGDASVAALVEEADEDSVVVLALVQPQRWRDGQVTYHALWNLCLASVRLLLRHPQWIDDRDGDACSVLKQKILDCNHFAVQESSRRLKKASRAITWIEYE